MKVNKEIQKYKSGSGVTSKYACWKCDKCNAEGFTIIRPGRDDLDEDQKKCCE